MTSLYSGSGAQSGSAARPLVGEPAALPGPVHPPDHQLPPLQQQEVCQDEEEFRRDFCKVVLITRDLCNQCRWVGGPGIKQDMKLVPHLYSRDTAKL